METPAQQNEDEYRIILPCAPEHFKGFIAGLLGTPQTIEGIVYGPFDISKGDVEDLYHLIEQRIAQQNEATLLQFSIRVVYDDSTSVLIDGLPSFLAYNEVRPVASIGAHLAWDLLVRFPNRDVPERQQIEVTFATYPILYDEDREIRIGRLKTKPGWGQMRLRIKHTARTWGADIESLLTGHLKGLVRSEPLYRQLIQRYSLEIAAGVGITFFLSSVVCSLLAINQFLRNRMILAKSLGQLNPADPATASRKVDYLIEVLEAGMWPRFFYYIGCLLVVSFVLAIVFTAWTNTSAEAQKPSYVEFSKHAKKVRQALEWQYNGKFRSFLWAVIFALVTGVAGNWLFSAYIQRWLP